jgi:CRP-like cAMP-binding protein
MTLDLHGVPGSIQLGVDPGFWKIPLKGPVHRLPVGAQLFQQGGSSDDVYFLRQGLVKLLRIQPNGDEAIVGLRATGWLLGAAAALQEHVYAATAVALIPCDVMRMGSGRFRKLVQKNAAFSWGMHRMHSSEVCAQICQLADLGALPARQRLEQLLGDLAPVLGSARPRSPVEIPLHKWEIAQLIAITPPYLSQLLGDLEREGWLSRRNGKITVL